jgi:7-carboxy-7-deazaguanine synthase
MPTAATLPDSFDAGPDTPTEYHVKAMFETLQGEAWWTGTPSIFVRLVGCNQWTGYEEDRERDAERHGSDCPLWCDTNFTPEGATYLTSRQICERLGVINSQINHVVFTGGEPFLQMDSGLIETLHEHGFYVHVETNGTMPLSDTFDGDEPDWICCSPKLPEPQTEIERIDELKLVVPDYRPRDYTTLIPRVRPREMAGETRKPMFVQPEDGPRLDEAKDLAVEIAKNDPRWRVSTQSHKTLGID